MCPKGTDAPAWKTWMQIANACQNITQIANAISDADRVGRTNGHGVTPYALSTILRMVGA